MNPYGVYRLLVCGVVANAVYDLVTQIHKVGEIIEEEQFLMRDTVIGGFGCQDKVGPSFRQCLLRTGR